VIAHIESGNNPNAIRFEPLVFASLTTGPMLPAHAQIVSTIQSIHVCNVKTAQVIYSTSFGLFQVMGFNLYGPGGTKESVFKFCTDVIEQVRVFDALCSTWNILFTAAELAASQDARTKFALRYNGAQAYADRIADALKSLNVPVTV
jgi:hypothetical protein